MKQGDLFILTCDNGSIAHGKKDIGIFIEECKDDEWLGSYLVWMCGCRTLIHRDSNIQVIC